MVEVKQRGMPGLNGSLSSGRKRTATRRAQWKLVYRDADIAPTSLLIDRCRKSLDRRRFLNASKRFAICEGIIATARALARFSMRFATAVRSSKTICECI